MKTLKIGLGVLALFMLVALTTMKKKNSKYSTLKGGETKTEIPIVLE